MHGEGMWKLYRLFCVSFALFMVLLTRFIIYLESSFGCDIGSNISVLVYVVLWLLAPKLMYAGMNWNLFVCYLFVFQW